MNKNNKLAIGIIDFGFIGNVTLMKEQNISVKFLNNLIEKFDIYNKYDLIMCLADCIIEEDEIDNDKKIKLQNFITEHRKTIGVLMDNNSFLKFHTFILKENIQLKRSVFTFTRFSNANYRIYNKISST